MLNYNFIKEKSAASKIDNITIEREYWQLILLQRLYLLKKTENIYFKGGTAIRFLLGSFRFSEDLDFTSILTKNTTEKLFLEVFNFCKKNAHTEIEIKKEKAFEKFEENSLKYRFLFPPQGSRQKVSVRIDVSFREKPIQKEASVLVPFDYPISPYPLVIHLGKEEILAEKIRAIFIRGKPRDLFDLWFLLTKQIPINEKIVGRKFEFYSGERFGFQKLKEIVASFNEKELKKDLNCFLPEHYRQFYRALKKETLKFLNQQVPAQLNRMS